MGKILCATRGGEASYRTQDAAIALAKERGDELLFLYVVDTSFLDKTAAPIVVDIEGGIEKMGKFLLAMAQERAARQGVEARAICHEGRVRQEIKMAAVEEKATTVVLGRPAGETSVFIPEALQSFAKGIESETGVEVVIV
jgi:nucleotide-binding universal stress UspA family protein